MTHPPCGLNAIAALYAAGGVALACPAYAADTGTGAAAGIPVVIVTGSRAEHR
jgi:hypothetical protein